MNFDQAFAALIGTEGSYSNRNPADDPGGETMWGVTARVARRHGYNGPMRDLPQDTAKAIYRSDYWDAVGCDAVPDPLRFDLFDAAVNSGTVQAIKWLQGAVFADVDGVIGAHTLLGITYMPVDKLRRRFNGLRLRFMQGLPNWKANSGGWAVRIADNLMRD